MQVAEQCGTPLKDRRSIRDTGGMIESLIRFLNRPVIITQTHPSRRARVAAW